MIVYGIMRMGIRLVISRWDWFEYRKVWCFSLKGWSGDLIKGVWGVIEWEGVKCILEGFRIFVFGVYLRVVL